jgi:hypothetical protein
LVGGDERMFAYARNEKINKDKRMEIIDPIKVSRTFTQSIIAPPKIVFPLLCPVREVEWANGWNPRLVISASGVVEPGCIFIMPDKPNDSVWVVTQWNPDSFFVEFIKVTPGFTVGKIVIQLHSGDNNATLADITYCYTALSLAGSEFVKQFTEDHYKSFMREWESEINHFLKTGKKKKAHTDNSC